MFMLSIARCPCCEKVFNQFFSGNHIYFQLFKNNAEYEESGLKEPGTPSISSEALSKVKLKPTTRSGSSSYSTAVPHGFDSDLRNALAKRRSKAGFF